MERDPVCGMSVDAIRATAQEEHAGRSYFFCCAGCANKFRADPAKYLNVHPPATPAPQSAIIQPDEGKPSPAASLPVNFYICPMDPEIRQDHPGACPKCGMALEPAVPPRHHANRIHLPDASGNRSRRSRARARSAAWRSSRAQRRRGRRKSRTRFDDAAILDQRRADDSGVHARNVRHDSRPARAAISSMRAIGWIELMLATPVVVWGGWPFFRARLGVARESQPEHVHADRARHRHGLHLQRDRSSLPADFPAIVSRDAWRSPGLFRGCRGDHGAGAARPGARTARAQPNLRRHPRRCSSFRRKLRAWFAPTAPKSTCPSNIFSAGDIASRAPGRKSSRRRSRDRRRELRGRIADDRRADSRRKNRGRRVMGGTVNGTGSF